MDNHEFEEQTQTSDLRFGQVIGEIEGALAQDPSSSSAPKPAVIDLSVAPPAMSVLIPATAAPKRSATMPPMLQDYLRYKDEYPDALLLFQVGDFYEVFFDDACIVARTLNLTLTSRDKNAAEPIPMCGVPIGVVDGYLDRLVTQGFSVAVVSQVGPVPQKGMVERRLERIVTPGIRILGEASKSQSIVGAIYFEGQEASIAFSDVQTGRISIKEGIALELIAAKVSECSITECVVFQPGGDESIDRRLTWVRQIEALVKSPVKLRARVDTSREHRYSAIVGMTKLARMGRRAAGLLLSYIEETTIAVEKLINEISLAQDHQILQMDPTTRANLELVTSQHGGGKEGSLYGFLDHTRSPMGSRLLRSWLVAPLRSSALIAQRNDIVEAFTEQSGLRHSVRRLLERSPDMERLAARIELGVVSPRELSTLRDLLILQPRFEELLNGALSSKLSWLIDALKTTLQGCNQLSQALQDFLVDEPPRFVSDGQVVKEGVSTQLDELRSIQLDGKGWITQFEQSERQRTGISSLKVKFHRILGYFIEVTNTHASKVPSDYIRRQATANAERFTMPSLKEREKLVVGAEAKILALEEQLYKEFRESLKVHCSSLRSLASVIAELDVLATFAEIAVRDSFVRPIIDESYNLEILNGRHPLLAHILGPQFVPNSVAFQQSQHRCFLLTGPNMGGKSTFLRQIGLITILSQIGAFVPAERATIGLVDRVFARLGASDNLLEGESTFMVEMREAAVILANATPQSLVLIDEIGRGTSTADGEALAQAILEWVVYKAQSRTLFATHFRKLTALADNSSSYNSSFDEVPVEPVTTQVSARVAPIANISVGSVEYEGEVVFTHSIQSGPANASYGVEVARMAGLPDPLIARARELINSDGQQTRVNRTTDEARSVKSGEPSAKPISAQLALNLNPINSKVRDCGQPEINSTVTIPALSTPRSTLGDQLLKEIVDCDLNSLTPLQALNYLAVLRERCLREK